MAANLTKLLMAGLLMGWGPCLLFCGPIILSYIAGTKSNWQSGLKITVIFSLARLLAVVLLGLLITIAFRTISHFFSSQVIYLLAAIFIIVIGMESFFRSSQKPLCRILKHHLEEKSSRSTLLLGFLIGLSPCGPLIAVFTYIGCVAKNAFEGFLYAFSFGMGTFFSPLLLLGTLVPLLPSELIKSPKILKIFRYLCGAILIGFGITLFLRGLRVLSLP